MTETTSLRPNRLPLTDAQKAANRETVPFGPVTTALHGKQDVRAFFEAGAAALLTRDVPEPEPPTAAETAEARDRYMRYYTPEGMRRTQALVDLGGVDVAAYRWTD